MAHDEIAATKCFVATFCINSSKARFLVLRSRVGETRRRLGSPTNILFSSLGTFATLACVTGHNNTTAWQRSSAELSAAQQAAKRLK